MNQIVVILGIGILLGIAYLLSENKKKQLEDIYEGKYSITPEIEDEKIFKTAINLNYQIIPSLPNWLEKKIKKNIYFKYAYSSFLIEPRFYLRINSLIS